MAKEFSWGVSRAIAEDFFEDAVILQNTQAEAGDVHYQIAPSGLVTVREEGGQDIGVSTTSMHLLNFIGGVAFALCESGEIPEENVTPQNMASVCYYAGVLIEKFNADHNEVGDGE